MVEEYIKVQACYCHDLQIPSSAGILEGKLHYREENQGKPGVILCPPHPLLAGNMDNNVITSLAERLSAHFPVLSFNYRAVGKSFKVTPELPLFEYWNKLDEKDDFSAIITDTKQVIQWSKRLFDKHHLLGYSFGSYIALLASSPSALSFTAITPPLVEHDFKGLEKLSCETCLIFAENDSLISTVSRHLRPQTVCHEIQDCDHFFLGREGEVAAFVETFLLACR